MEILLTWVGLRDPTWHNTRTGEEDLGPILSLLTKKHFDKVYLFFNLDSSAADYRARATATLHACRRHFPSVETIHHPVELVSITDYREIFRVVNHECQGIIATEGREDKQFFVYLSPGTPQMQTCWVLLVQSGLLPARMLEATPRDLVLPGAPSWREVDLSIPGFPQVVDPGETERIVGILEAKVENLIAENLRLEAEIELLRAGGDTAEDSVIEGFNLRRFLTAQERAWYIRALEQARGNGAEAARLLGIHQHAFRKRAADLEIRQRRSRSSP